MSGPLVTIGVPVYQGGADLLITLENLRTQTYPHLDIHISVDGADRETAQSCEAFLGRDARFRMTVQPARLGWAGNTDFTMRSCRGDFYIFQQHDDQVSPDYVADLVVAALERPRAAVCFAKVHSSGVQNFVTTGFSLSGDRPIDRLLSYLETIDCVPFRGLVRAAALAESSGLLLSDFDPFDSYGTENRFLAELARWGDFVHVPGPIYYKRLHGQNLHLKRAHWPDEKRLIAWALLAAWMIEVIVPEGSNVEERRALLFAVVTRFVVPHAPLKWVRPLARLLSRTKSVAFAPLRAILARIKRNEGIVNAVTGRWMLYEPSTAGQRRDLVRTIFKQLQQGGRLDVAAQLDWSWEQIEQAAAAHFEAGSPPTR